MRFNNHLPTFELAVNTTEVPCARNDLKLALANILVVRSKTQQENVPDMELSAPNEQHLYIQSLPETA